MIALIDSGDFFDFKQAQATMTSMIDGKFDGPLLLEEFIQMHEHLRKREEAMHQILNLTATGAVTLLAAIAAFILQIASTSPEKLLVWHCYLFLLPVPLLVIGLSMLSAHRDDIFKMGYYIKVFFEEKIGGAAWHVRLENLRHLGESQDPTLFVLWILFALASALFMLALLLTAAGSRLHLLATLPMIFAMIYQHLRFMKCRKPIEVLWRNVRSAEETGPKQVPGANQY